MPLAYPLHTLLFVKVIRVAHIMQYFAIGGLERMVQSLALESQARGVSPVVVGYLDDGPIREELNQLGVETRILTPRRGFSPGYALDLRRLLREVGAEVVHTHHVGPFLYGAPAALSLGLPVVHTEHSHELYESGRMRSLGLAMDYLARVIAVSPEIASYRRLTFGRACQVVRNGVTCNEPHATREKVRLQWGASFSTFVVGCIARLAPEKDHATLIRAFHALKNQLDDCLLVIVGEGPVRPELERLIGELGLGARVRMLGARTDVASLLPAMDTVALTSQREGLPLALLEAMAHRRPVLATRVGGVPELLSGGGGMLIEAGDHNACADALLSLARNPHLRTQLAQKAFAQVQNHYSSAAMTEAYLNVYREVLQHKSPTKEGVPCASAN